MNNSQKLMKNIENKVGLSLQDIKSNSPYKTRIYLEGKNRKTFKFVSAFPFIGRRNVLRDSIRERSQIDFEIDQILAR